MGQYQPINIFLRQEIDRMQKVILAVRNTLNDLKLAIDGTIVMNETLRDALDCMYDARIPAHWLKVCFSFHRACNFSFLGFEVCFTLSQKGTRKRCTGGFVFHLTRK